MLIKGDNLLALKALEQDYRGKVKCIYIDPPYNTGNAFEHYDDGLEHSIWLGLMRDRIEHLYTLLSEDGVFFIQLDDSEVHYAKVMMDEIFGRKNFVNMISCKMKSAGVSGSHANKSFKKDVEYILIYIKNINKFNEFNELMEEQNLFDLMQEMKEESKSWKYTRVLKDYGTKTYLKEIYDGSGQPIKIYNHKNVIMQSIKDLAVEENISEEECYKKYFNQIFRDTNAQSSIRARVMEAVKGEGDFFSIDYVPISGKSKGKTTTLYYKGEKCDLIAWLRDVAIKKGNRLLKLDKIGTYWEGFPLNNLTKEGGVKFPQGKKPEALIKRVLQIATNPGDLVLDSFAGSGTTGAVAHKMGRRWIMVELGEHAHTHIVPRLNKVINGEDQGGISKSVNFQGGGGFRYYNLAPSLLLKDKYGQWIMSKEYNAEMLSEAMCKLMNFRYEPSKDIYWMQGIAHEGSYIYVTTNHLNKEYLQSLSDEVGRVKPRALLVCCKAFHGGENEYENLLVKKIPKAVLKKCEWARDDYSLNIKNLPTLDEVNRKKDEESMPLFGADGESENEPKAD